MASGASTSLTRQLGALFEGGSTAGLSDRQLLERFATASRRGRLRRPGHTPRADGAGRLPPAPGRPPACRGRLPGRLPRPGPQGRGRCASPTCWATGSTASPSAPHARPDAGSHAADGPRRPAPSAIRRRDPAVQAEQAIDHEQAEALHREIDRLPDAFRRAVVLCYFEGLSPDEAAARLRWPSGTLRSRLVRARRSCAAAWLAAVWSSRRPRWPRCWRRDRPRRPSHPSCAIPPPGPRSPSRPVTPPPAGRLAAAALAREVLRSMLIHKLKLTAMALCSWPSSPPAPAGSASPWP